MQMISTWRKNIKIGCQSQRGASLLGYGLMVGLIAIIALVAISNVGQSVKSLFSNVSTSMDDITQGDGVSTPVIPSVVSLSALSANNSEGDSGTTAFTFTASLDTVSGGDINVNWSVIVGSADASDFSGGVLPSGIITILANQTDATITVNIAGDTEIETDENFTIQLDSIASGSANLGSPLIATGTIQNDDTVPSNAIFAWGSDNNGGLGNGAITGDQASPSAVAGGLTFISISAGLNDNLACGIATGGTAYCWGSDTNGVLGNGAITGTQTSPSPVDTAGSLPDTYISIGVGSETICGIATGGAAYCWGRDGSGQLGNGAITGTQTSPSPVDTAGGLPDTYIAISAAQDHACGIATGGAAYCWGEDQFTFNLGNGSGITASQASPSPVDTAGGLPDTYIAIEAGNGHTCAIATGGAAYCWGNDFSGQLGNGGTTGTQVSPSPVSGGLTFASIATSSSSRSCGLTTSGAIYCWGTDSLGQLGNGAITGNQTSPSPVDTAGILPDTYIALSASGSNTVCGIANDNTAWCWGRDSSGQLGNGTTLTSDQISPSPVDTSGGLPTTYIAIATGGGTNGFSFGISQ